MRDRDIAWVLALYALTLALLHLLPPARNPWAPAVLLLAYPVAAGVYVAYRRRE